MGHNTAAPERTPINLKRLAIICTPLAIITILVVLFMEHLPGTKPTTHIAITERTNVSLYLPDKEGKLVEKTVGIKAPESNREKADTIVAALKTAGVVSENLTLQDFVTDSDGIMYLNFSKDLVTNPQGERSDGEIVTVFSIVNSFLANFSYTRKVQFLVDWQPVHTIHGIVYTYLPMEFNRTIVED